MSRCYSIKETSHARQVFYISSRHPFGIFFVHFIILCLSISLIRDLNVCQAIFSAIVCRSPTLNRTSFYFFFAPFNFVSTMSDPHVCFLMFNRRWLEFCWSNWTDWTKTRNIFFPRRLYFLTFGFHKKKFQFQYWEAIAMYANTRVENMAESTKYSLAWYWETLTIKLLRPTLNFILRQFRLIVFFLEKSI